MQKTIFTFTLLLASLLFNSFQDKLSAAQPDNKDTILLAAKKELLQTLKKIPIGDEHVYGFNNREEFNNASLGQLLKVYYINSKGSVKGLQILTNNEYRLPVIVGTEFRALLTVSLIDGNWHIVDFGAVGLAKDIENYLNLVHPNKDYAGVFLRIYGINSDFIASKKEDQLVDSCNFYPLQSAKIYLDAAGFIKKDYYNLSSLFQIIKNTK